MALIIDSYPDPTDPTTPIQNAYAWVFDIHLNLGLGDYWVSVWIHRSEEAASVVPPPPPLDRLVIQAGDELVPAKGETPAFLAPSLTEVFAMAEQVKAANPGLSIWDAIKSVIYSLASEHHKLSPNTVV